MFKLIYAVSVGTILLLAGAVPVSACNPAPPEAAVYLTLGLDTKTTSPAPHLAVYNFGDVDHGSTAPIKHQFLLKNSTPSPLLVDRLTVSCVCTTAVVGGGGVLPYTVAPGKEIEVDTSIDPLRLYAGAVEKSVSVYIAGQAQPAAVLEV